MLRLAFDAKRLFNNFTGLGNYSRTLVQDLATQYPAHAYYLYTPKVIRNAQTNPFSDHASFQIREPKFMPATYWRSRGIKRQLQQDNIQVYHGLSHEIPFGIQKTTIKSVVTIHDLIFHHYPQHYSAIDRKIYNYKFKYACTYADQIVAISESTKKDILELYKVPEEKIKVVYQNCDPIFNIKINQTQIESTLQKYQFPKKYLLYVGAITERKNLLGLVKAIDLLPKDLQLPLIVIGKGKNYEKKVKQYVQQQELTHLIHFAGHIDQGDLPTLYQGATIFIYPSFYEGFGIPIIEALYSKTPVITSNVSSLPEAAGPHACYIDPSQPNQIATGIQKILMDKKYRKEMVDLGYAHVQQFNAENSSASLMKIYQDLVALKK